MKPWLFSLGWGLVGLSSLAALPKPAIAQVAADFDQYLAQVQSNNSWASTSFPVENFRNYLSLYGDYRIVQGQQEFNRGIDIQVDNNSAVRSWLGGRIAQITSDQLCGVSVLVESGPWQHRYCHLRGQVITDAQGQRSLVDPQRGLQIQEGQAVTVGTRLGYISPGDMGEATRLHWEVQYANQWIDPRIVLNIMSTQQQQVQPAPIPPTVTAFRQPANARIMALRQAIIGQESGKNFRAVNPHSGALGYGQVMPSNVGAWSLEALGYAITREQFLNSPELQLQIIEYKLAQYWDKAWRRSNGDEAQTVRMVASQWYSGDPTLFNTGRPESYKGHAYPSIRDYTLSVLSRYQNYVTGNTAWQGSPVNN